MQKPSAMQAPAHAALTLIEIFPVKDVSSQSNRPARGGGSQVCNQPLQVASCQVPLVPVYAEPLTVCEDPLQINKSMEKLKPSEVPGREGGRAMLLPGETLPERAASAGSLAAVMGSCQVPGAGAGR